MQKKPRLSQDDISYVAKGIIRQYFRSKNKEGFLDGLHPFLGIIDEGPYMEEDVQSALCINQSCLYALKKSVDKWDEQDPTTPAGRKKVLIGSLVDSEISNRFKGYGLLSYAEQMQAISGLAERWNMPYLKYSKHQAEIEEQASKCLRKKLESLTFESIEALYKGMAESVEPPREVSPKVPKAPAPRRVLHVDTTETRDGWPPRSVPPTRKKRRRELPLFGQEYLEEWERQTDEEHEKYSQEQKEEE